MYAIGSAVGPHPFPMMIEYFQSVVGREAGEQFIKQTVKLLETDYIKYNGLLGRTRFVVVLL